MNKFVEVGKKAGLTDLQLKAFVFYMMSRWDYKEEIQCRSGYAKEWAERFKRGTEYNESDEEGQEILKKLYRSILEAKYNE